MAFTLPDDKKIIDLEKETLSFWQKNEIFKKSVDQRSADNLYVFYDGPPFISGLPHYGHLLGSIAKDLIPRYWTMKGKKVERVWGWDAHGLTVENKVQAELGIKNRKEIEAYGLEKFIQACYDYTSRISGEWQWYIDRIGRWVDMENAYKTIDQVYMESVMWAFKKIWEKGLIYEGVRTSLYCPTCGTPVSNFEVAMDNSYKDVEDPAVTIKFKLKSDKFENSYLLAWTTTPWTLPANKALVVNEKETYVLVKNEGENLIVAKERVGEVLGESVKILQEISGKDLVGLDYEPLFTIFAHSDKDFKVYSFENMVSAEEGTGIVHSAPGFGEIDTEMGKFYGLSVAMALDDGGKYIAGDASENPFEGVYYSKANDLIIDDLKNRNLLFKNEKIIHRFPYHDRCNTNLIQRAQNSWFVKVSELKAKMLENNKEINWVPSHLKEGRFVQGIEQAPDWCISRSRFWATPMPVWKSEDGEIIVIGSIKELEDLSGKKVENLHRPYIDEVVIEKDGKTFKRIPDVLDSWFEAGSMPYAQIHYPFENEEKFEKNFPGDYIVEYIAQVRAWFYVMHVLSTAIFGKASFKNVISTGVMAGSDGRKMSKTYGNYTDPKDALETVGGDALRLYLMGSPLMVGENANFDDLELKTKSKNILNPLWNSLKYFLIYSQAHDFKPENYDMPNSSDALDIWIMARLEQTTKNITEFIENYTTPQVITEIETFVDDLSRWYVRRSRDKISSGNIESLKTLFYVLSKFSKVAAPVIPFMTEAMFKFLAQEGELSVHLENYPDYDESFIDQNLELIEQMKTAREIVSLALASRVEKEIPVRQPLGVIKIDEKLKIIDSLIKVVLEEINVKTFEYADLNESKIELDTNLSQNLINEGVAREIIRALQEKRKEAGLNVSDKISAKYKSDEKTEAAVTEFEDYIMQAIGAESLDSGSDYEVSKVS